MTGDTKILSSSKITAWRKSVARAGGNLAVIVGTFNILQPGNLFGIRQAKRRASNVCVVLEPGKAQNTSDGLWNPPHIRAEIVSFLQDVSAVFIADTAEHDLQQLRPYILVDCNAQAESGTLRQTARAEAETIVDIPPVKGCFTRMISEALCAARTPIEVPLDSCEPIPTQEDIDDLRANCRKAGGRLVTVNGCFDLLHIGHLRMLAQARKMGHELIVLVNDDVSVRAYKGHQRPVFPIHFRLQALNALVSVSLAYPFSGDNPLAILSSIHPDIHVKGGTFEEDRVHQEQKLLESWGGRLEFCPMIKGLSTSSLIESL